MPQLHGIDGAGGAHGPHTVRSPLRQGGTAQGTGEAVRFPAKILRPGRGFATAWQKPRHIRGFRKARQRLHSSMALTAAYQRVSGVVQHRQPIAAHEHATEA